MRWYLTQFIFKIKLHLSNNKILNKKKKSMFELIPTRFKTNQFGL